MNVLEMVAWIVAFIPLFLFFMFLVWYEYSEKIRKGLNRKTLLFLLWVGIVFTWGSLDYLRVIPLERFTESGEPTWGYQVVLVMFALNVLCIIIYMLGFFDDKWNIYDEKVEVK